AADRHEAARQQPRSKEHPRQRHLGGPLCLAGGQGHRRHRADDRLRRPALAAAARHHGRRGRQRDRLPVQPPGGGDHRACPLRRLRLQRHGGVKRRRINANEPEASATGHLSRRLRFRLVRTLRIGKKGVFRMQATSTTPSALDRCRAIASSPWLWLSLLTLGLGVRLVQYFTIPSYWYDEAFLLVNIYDRDFAELIGPLRAECVIPPFFLWVLRVLFLLFGDGELAMRLPALAAGVAGLVLIIPLARRVVGSPGWIAGLALCAVSHHALTHSYEVRP